MLFLAQIQILVCSYCIEICYNTNYIKSIFSLAMYNLLSKSDEKVETENEDEEETSNLSSPVRLAFDPNTRAMMMQLSIPLGR